MSLTKEELADSLDAFAQAQQALILRLEAKNESLEQMLAAMVTGYIDVTAIVTALLEDRLVTDDDKTIVNAIVENKKKLLEALQSGKINAQDQFDKFLTGDNAYNDEGRL